MSAPMAASDAAANAAAALISQRQSNGQYLATTIEKVVNVPPAGGGIYGQFVAGQNIIYTVPPVNNGYLRAIRMTFAITFNYTPFATSPTIALNAAAPYNLIREIQIQFNGLQGRINPFIANLRSRLSGWLRPQFQDVVMAGYSDPSVQSLVRSSSFPIASGNNTWLWTLDIPLNALHSLDAAGMLPIMGEANPVQVVVICNPSIVGVDPLYNTVVLGGTGAGGTATATGTIKVDALYRDGTTMYSPSKMQLNLQGLDTAQWLIDAPVNNLVAGQMSRGPIKTSLEHYYVLSCVIDGQQSSQFSIPTNIAGIELDVDGTGSNRLQAFGAGLNVGMERWFEYVRSTFGQDMPEGIIPWVVAPSYNQANPSNRMGSQTLNMTPNGWTTIYQGVNLTSVGAVSGIAPRIETFLISSNPLGLIQG